MSPHHARVDTPSAAVNPAPGWRRLAGAALSSPLRRDRSAQLRKMLQRRITTAPNEKPTANLFDCAAPRALCSSRGKRTTMMIETVTALFGFLSAGILAAHAYDGYRARF